jgi:hypothetical protein
MICKRSKSVLKTQQNQRLHASRVFTPTDTRFASVVAKDTLDDRHDADLIG